METRPAAAAVHTVPGMDAGWAVAGSGVGLLAGTLARPTARRLAAPPGGAAPPLRLLAPTTALALALVAGRIGGRPELPAFGWLTVVGVALAFVDVAAHRLPDRLVLPAYPVVLAGLAVAALALGRPDRLVGAVAGGAALAGGYLVLVLLRPGQLGLGDLKLGGLLGLGLGWLGWSAVLAGSLLAFLLFAGCALALLATGRATRRTALPFGPFMLAAALLVVLR